jgi:hypothetical protein
VIATGEEVSMTTSLWAIILAALLPAADGSPPPATDGLMLRPGQKLVLRVRQVIPCDGLSPGERLLNSRPLLVPGDRFLADVLHDATASGVLVGGTVTRVHPPGWFGRPGHVEIRLVQLLELREGMASPMPLRVDLKDHRLCPQACRCLANLYFGFEGGDVGASIGAQLAQGNLGFILGGAGIGFVVGLGAAALVHGPEGKLEPDDTFEITVGTCSYRPLPRTAPMTVYPPCVPIRK